MKSDERRCKKKAKKNEGEKRRTREEKQERRCRKRWEVKRKVDERGGIKTMK